MGRPGVAARRQAAMRRRRFAVTLLAALYALAAGRALRADERIELFAGDDPAALDVEPVRVFREGAVVHVHVAGTAVPRLQEVPKTRYFAGAVRGEPGSLAVLALEPDGRGRGLVVTRGQHFRLAREGAAWKARLAPAVDTMPAGERCAADDVALLADPIPAVAHAGGTRATTTRGGGMLAAVVAVETDFELYDALGSTAAVVSHVGDLFAAVAAIYRNDLDTDVQVGDLFVWTTPDDPFDVQSNFFAALDELGDHWHDAHPTVERTLVHFVSGKTGLLGGVAYHGVLCTPDTPVGSGHWGGGYSLTGAHTLFGDFRNLYVTSHELGHNFRAYHTHCFTDLPSPGDPEVDRCRSGEVRNDGHACYAGPESMPPDGGSIMSYCHLQPGGYANINLSLGAAGSYGNASERVVNRMLAHVQSVGCLVPAEQALFDDGFEIGDLVRWSATAP